MASQPKAASTELADQVSVEEIERWVAESRRYGVNIVVVGETGVGKSTLINGLLGADVIRGRTKAVNVYPVSRGEVELKVFDTPGLFDPCIENSDILKEIAYETEGKVDLVVYCHDLRTTVRNSGVEAIGLLVTTLNQSKGDLWENVMYVLTHANSIEEDLIWKAQGGPTGQVEQELSVKELFSDLLHQFEDFLRERAQRVIKEPNAVEIARNIPVVPAGYRKKSLLDRVDWRTSLWKEALSRVNATAVPAFIAATASPRLQHERAGPGKSGQLPEQRRLYLSQSNAEAGIAFRAIVMGAAAAAPITIARGGFGHNFYKRWR